MDGNFSFHAELLGVVRPIEYAYLFGWSKLWLETKSKLAILATDHDSKVVPWNIHTR